MESTAVEERVGVLRGNPGFLASRFSYLAAKASDAALAPFDLSIKPYALLELASVSPRSQRELGRILCLDPSRVLRLVDQLTERGSVERVPDAADRRVTLIRATPSGRRLAVAAAAALAAATTPLTAGLSADERAELLRLLGIVALEE
ncbi:MarR family winged helix-turn-helix transcriptional regulator [Microbacterium elymi]|uniref:MarR family transcriptional regulator n=1 Tax=Microbacterium elymi TaxID=2909587 RepID=A0ABY5NLU1_9MICO|nr:MarR family transcriptional regulator [Microbacterium elymi]UUT36115.1 MarR family transcriptional regulator [Microbacterium elymi]